VTGLIMSQLILGEKPVVSLDAFRCERFPIGYTLEKREELRIRQALAKQKTPNLLL